MSADAENYNRNINDDSKVDRDYASLINLDLPLEEIHNILVERNMNEKEIDKVLDKIKAARHRINKAVRHFMRKIDEHYGHLDVPELMKKGMKHAKKAGLSDLEIAVFRKHVMKGDIYNMYSYQNDLKYSRMSKFLGFDSTTGQMIKIEPKDYSKLNELHALYDNTKHIHADVKNQLYNYRDCAPEAITGKYDRTKHNVNVSIHPVLAALFLPKVDYLEKTMLYTNIARLILSRARAYLNDYNLNILTNIAPGELDAEYQLAYDIANDPNALEYFENESPIDNIIKRFRCQIELYKSILNLRQGIYYSTGYSVDDGISGFLRIINSYDWTFFDSPELFHVQDEGTILRKLLAVFSCRPSFTQLTSYTERFGLGYTSINNISKTVFVNIPIINIKLPMDPIDESRRHTLNLRNALNQVDFFIEHKIVVPKNKSVIYSNSVAFFYANRRYPSVNFNTLSMNMRCVSIPVSFVNQTMLNHTVVNFESRFKIGRDWFDLRSVVVLQRPPINNIEVATGCSAMIVASSQNSPYNINPDYAPLYLHYSPSTASLLMYDEEMAAGTPRYGANTPVADIDEYSDPNYPKRIGFKTEARERGTIFFYVRDRLDVPCN